MVRKTRQSRRKTPWDNTNMTPTQQFIHDQHKIHYDQRHPSIEETGEAGLINSHVPSCCPYCKSPSFTKFGLDSNGIQRYRCSSCGQRFKPTTGTIFDSRRIPISEWIEYCTNIFRYVSLNADSWNNKNALSTSKYWLEKLFLTLQGSQDSIVLSDTVWLDETYYTVIMKDRQRHEDGTLLKGLSRNQICIGVATDKKHTICFIEGFGKPSQKSSYETFKDHIAEGSVLIHDKETTHRKLVQHLSLKSKTYSSKDLKGLADSENPLEPVNRIHSLLKMFLNSHSGFNRDDLQGYLDLYAFVVNPPSDYLEKVEKLINLVFENPKSLRYREQFGENT